MKTSMPSRWLRAYLISSVLVCTSAMYGCAASPQLVRHPAVELDPLASAEVAWFGPDLTGDLTNLSRWRRSVGPPVVRRGNNAVGASDRLIVVNWNTHVGAGDFQKLYADVRRQAGGDVPVVFLLQEAYRGGPEVPNALDRNASFASLIRELRKDGGREEIESIAESLGLHAYYVPSMRNGGPITSDEDRGNAILSTVPLTDLAAIELPFERQRRVAVAATVSGTTVDGKPWRLRVVSAHLDNMAGARRLWLAGGMFSRTRQAKALVAALADQSPLVLGGDLNTWFGFRDGAYRAAAREFPQTKVTDHRSTFQGLLRLDHLFFRLREGWTASFRRADDNYGSDHFPLVGAIDFTP